MSGGNLCALRHAEGLAQEGHEVTIAYRYETGAAGRLLPDEGLQVVPLSTATNANYDVAISTWWETNFSLSSLPASSYVWFCQSMEDRFYQEPDFRIHENRAVTKLAPPIITEATWICDQMRGWDPTHEVELVRNGLDHRLFHEKGRKRSSERLRVLVEGNMGSPFKAIGETLGSLALCREPIEIRHVSSEEQSRAVKNPRYERVGPLSIEEMADEYRSCDVLVKLSRVEGMFGPPLEAFGCGATAVVTPVTGHDEYIKHNENALVVNWDDPRSVASAVDRLARDRTLLSRLQTNAIQTATNWPSWGASSREFERALLSIMDRDASNGFPSQSAAKAIQVFGEFSNYKRGAPSVARRSPEQGFTVDSWS